MKNTFYIATASQNGLEKGKYYFVGADRKVFLQNGKRVPFFHMRKILKPITYFEGEFKEEWKKGMMNIKMELRDFVWYQELIVKLIEIHKKKKGLVCLAQIPGSKEYVQIDIYHEMET